MFFPNTLSMSSQKIKVKLPDGSAKEFGKGVSCLEVAKAIGPRLAEASLAAKVDGKLVDMAHVLEKDCSIKLLTFDDAEGKAVFWHSTNHVLAQAVLELFPGTSLGFGPAIEEGFYYDFDKKEPFTPEDLQKIEKKMSEIVKANFVSKRVEVSKSEAKKLLEKDRAKNKLRFEALEEIPEKVVSFYEQGPFTDLCRGPHIPSTGLAKAFKLLKISSAYWKGDQKNQQLQRIYGISFPSKKQLDEHLRLLEEAEKRDHRKIGAQLDLFSTQEMAGAGMIFWHPKGALLRKLVVDFVEGENFKRGYQTVVTPHLFKVDTWKTSGHYDYYKENMYFVEIDGVEHGIKPMNCPGHIMIYKTRSRSYKELPIRFSEFGTVYRHELSGVLSGLFRVRGFAQDDSHLFFALDQLHSEARSCLEYSLFLLRAFGFSEFVITLSTRPEKSIGSPEIWERAEAALKSVLSKLKLKYVIDEGGGSFYGPKIDVKVRDALGRLWQCSTIQVDFNQPERFDVSYVGADGQKHRCVMIHRASLGSFERFIGVLLEHYAGALPLWLSPVQVSLLPVADRHNDFAYKLSKQLSEAGLRCVVDDSQNKTGFKIREAQLQKIPVMLVVGDKEEESGKLVVRLRDGSMEEGVPVGEFVNTLLALVDSKK